MSPRSKISVRVLLLSTDVSAVLKGLARRARPDTDFSSHSLRVGGEPRELLGTNAYDCSSDVNLSATDLASEATTELERWNKQTAGAFAERRLSGRSAPLCETTPPRRFSRSDSPPRPRATMLPSALEPAGKVL
jgi:hypothetical protein